MVETMSMIEKPESQQAEQPASAESDTVFLKPAGIQQIIELLPHRYPFLLVDRITEHAQNKYIKGYKNVSMNEPFFQGHFPGDPIMPGVLQLEALAQIGAVLIQQSKFAQPGKLTVFAGMDNVRFRRIVVPGDRLDMECTLIKFRAPIGKSSCKAYVNGELAVEADLMFSMVDRTNI